MDALIQVVTRVRALRAEMGLRPRRSSTSIVNAVDPAVGRAARGAGAADPVPRPGRDGDDRARARRGRRDLTAGVEIGIAVEKHEMRDRRSGASSPRSWRSSTAEIARSEERLSNPDFLGKAPAHVVEGGRARLAEMRERHGRPALRAWATPEGGRGGRWISSATSRSC